VLFVLGVLVVVIGVALSIALHEIGHLVPAKKFGVKVGQYMIGFGPTIWSRKYGETQYGIKALPLGGYISMAGMFPPARKGGKARTASTGFFDTLVQDARTSSADQVNPGDEDRVFALTKRAKLFAERLNRDDEALETWQRVLDIDFSNITALRAIANVWRTRQDPQELVSALHATIDRAAALLISTGRDDSNILVTLTARKLSPNVKISVTIRETDNEDIARQAGADTVINPVSFTGLLLASSIAGPYRADYIADLATSAGRGELRERIVGPADVGRTIAQVCVGQAVRLVRDSKAFAPGDAAFSRLQSGDRILEIVDSN
jgi:membrane-associated protease RseP (regulator of RpoE activity)